VTALIHAELLKLRTTRLVPGLLLGLVGLVVLFVVAHVTQNSAEALDASPEDAFSGAAAAVILVLLVGVTVTAGEWRHNTITATLLVAPVRERVLAAKLVAALVMGFAFGVAAIAVNVLIAWPALSAKGAQVSPFDEPAMKVLGATLLGCALWAALGAAVGAVTRNQVSAIVGAVVWFLIAEPLVGSLLDDVGRYLPGAALGDIFGNGGGLSRLGGTAVSLAWIAAIGAVGAVLVVRDDVS
jgi:ABC-2 type transport system permease protein